MPHYRYLIVGAGMAGDAAVRGIREADTGGSIGLIGAEPHRPYNRPPLSKGLWKDQSIEQIWRDTATLGADLHTGRRAVTLEPQARRVTDDRGTPYTYEKLLIATGGTPRRLPGIPAPDPVIYFRNVDDYQRLRALAGERRRFAVLGGGFIGSEIAAALVIHGREVVMLFPEEGIGARVFPKPLARAMNDYYRGKGVEVLAGELVAAVQAEGDRVVLTTKRGRRIDADAVVAGLGITPNTELAQSAGLEVEDGIVVDEFLRAGHPDIYAAGDIVRFHNPALGTRIRVEHEDNANTMGRLAGRNMAGAREPYRHLPFFYSDLFDLGYEAVGEVTSEHQTVADWKEPNRKGVVYYLDSGRRVRGVLLWNTWDRVDAARKLIRSGAPFETAERLE